MRWILVFLFLYLIPIVVIFRNYNNFKRSCIYSSIYTILVSSIVMTNMYVSGLNKIKEALYYENYSYNKHYEDKESLIPKEENNSEDIKVNEENQIDKVDEEETSKKETYNFREEDNLDYEISNSKTSEKEKIKDDKELVSQFKKEIYEIEIKALVPMRDCMPYTKDIAKNLSNLKEIKKDIEYAKEMCEEVIALYDNMDVPDLSQEEYTKALSMAKEDVKKAYILREKAMEYSLTLVETKNIKYIGKITQYLNLSDNHITNFKDRLNDLNNNI